MVQGYLLDTCIVSYWFDNNCPQNQRLVRKIDSLPTDSPLAVSVITWGEIESGHQAKSKGTPTPVQLQFRAFLDDQGFMTLDIRKTTTPYYGQLRALLVQKCGPRNKRRVRLWHLIDPVTSQELGVDENDLWIAAQAMEHNLVLVTSDKMANIKSITKDLILFEDWTG